MNSDDLVELQKFGYIHEAELAVATLDAANIDAILRESGYGGIRPEISVAGGGVAVLVRRDQWQAAREVLDSPVSQHGSAAGGESYNCAECGRPLPSATAYCTQCNAEEHETVLSTHRMTGMYYKLKAAIIGGMLALVIIPVILRRVGWDETILPALGWVVGGFVVAVILVKVFASSSEERL